MSGALSDLETIVRDWSGDLSTVVSDWSEPHGSTSFSFDSSHSGTSFSFDSSTALLMVVPPLVEIVVVVVELVNCWGNIDTSLWLQLVAATWQIITSIVLLMQACHAFVLVGEYSYSEWLILRFVNNIIVFIEILETLAGYGAPEAGGNFCAGYLKFSNEIFDILKSAAPENWSGDAAKNYEQKNIEQQLRVQQIMDADREIAGILTRQSGQVEQGREAMAAARVALFSFAMRLQIKDYFCAEDWRSALERTHSVITAAAYLSFLVLVEVGGVVSAMAGEAQHNAKLLRSARRKYILVIDGVGKCVSPNTVGAGVSSAVPSTISGSFLRRLC